MKVLFALVSYMQQRQRRRYNCHHSFCSCSWGCIHVDTSTSTCLSMSFSYEWISYESSVHIRSYKAQTLVIQSPLKIGRKLWNTLNVLQTFTPLSPVVMYITVDVKIVSLYLYHIRVKCAFCFLLSVLLTLCTGSLKHDVPRNNSYECKSYSFVHHHHIFVWQKVDRPQPWHQYITRYSK